MKRHFLVAALLCVSAPAAAQDLNEDGSADVLDLTAMVSHIQGVETLPSPDAADIDGDGVVTVRDIVLFVKPIHGCESATDCGPGYSCDSGRCFAQPHDHGLRPEPEPEDEPGNNGGAPTCCASTAFKLAARATSNGGGELTVEQDYIDYMFPHACLSRTQDNAEYHDSVWLQPARDEIARGVGTQHCPQITLDNEGSGERRLQNLNCETTLRFRTGDLPTGDTSSACAGLVGVDIGPGPDPVDACGGLPDCLARSFTVSVPEIDEAYAVGLLADLFPGKTAEAVEAGEFQVRIIATDDSFLIVQKADGSLVYQDARLTVGNAADLTSESAITTAEDWIDAHPSVFGNVRDSVLKVSAQPEFSAYVAEPRPTSVQVNFALGVEASVVPGQSAPTPVIGWHLRVNVDGDGTVTGLAARFASPDLASPRLVEGPPLLITTEPDVRAQIAEIGPYQHTGVLPPNPTVFYRSGDGTTVLDLAYALDAHAPLVNSSAHSHNLRTWWPATPDQLSVTLIAPRRSQVEADTFEIDGPIRFRAEPKGGVPPYKIVWRLEDAPVESRDGFPATFPTPIEGDEIEIELAPDTRTEVRVLVTDSTGRRANDRALIITGLDAVPGTVVPGEDVPAPPEVPDAPTEGNPYECPAPEGDLILNQRIAGFGWTASAEISDTDGMQLSDVRFQNSRLAARMNLPFYKLTTAKLPETRCELTKTPGAADQTCRSVLMSPGLRITADEGPFSDGDLTATAGTLRSAGRVEARACWCVDNVDGTAGDGNDSILHVCHVFKFHAEGEGCSPDPAGVACAKWEPTIEYVYQSKSRDTGFRRIVTYQRHDYEMDARVRTGDRGTSVIPTVLAPSTESPVVPSDGDIATFNADHDDIRVVLPGVGAGPVAPLQTEGSTTMARFGGPGMNDAHHQIGQAQGVFTTVIIPGCSLVLNHLNGYQCLHSHWRWGAFIDEYFLFGDDTDTALGSETAKFGLVPGINGILARLGKAIIPPGTYGFGNVLIPSTQKETVHVVKFGTNEFESDPAGLGGDTFDPAGRSQDQEGIEKTLRRGAALLITGFVRGVVNSAGGGLEDADAATRLVGAGFNALADKFFAPFRINVRGADLVTWYETESWATGKRDRPEILQKNAHFFFR